MANETTVTRTVDVEEDIWSPAGREYFGDFSGRLLGIFRLDGNKAGCVV